MSPTEKPTAAKYRGAARRVVDIENELRRLGRWQDVPLPPKALKFKAPFAADTMSFEQWLQFVLVPRVREICATGGEFPERSEVGVYAVRNLDGDDAAANLVRLLTEFDAFITGSGEEPAVPGQAPEATIAYGPALMAYRDGEFLAEVKKIRESLGAPIEFDVDWDSVDIGAETPDEKLKAFRDLRYRGVSDVRSALLLLRSNFGAEAATAVAARLRSVRLRNIPADRPERCEFANGVLSIDVNLRAHAVRDLKPGKVLVDALDLRVTPVVESLKTETIPTHEKHLEEVLEAPVAIEVDFASFRAEQDVDLRIEALGNCAREGVYYVAYALESATRDETARSAARSRLTTLRVRHVTDPAERDFWAEGSTVTMAARFHSDSKGRFDVNELEWHLPAVLAGLPAPVIPANAATAERRKEECARIAAEFSSRLTRAHGSPVALEVDFSSIAADADALARVPRRALQRVGGALLYLAPTFAAVSGGPKIRTVRIRFSDCRSVAVAGGAVEIEVNLAAAPSGNLDEGFFFERDLAKHLSDLLGLSTAPIIEKLVAEMLPGFRERIRENIGADMEMEVEWDGFLAHDDISKREWALNRLEQDGLEHLYYALSTVAEKGEEFARLIRRRVRRILVQHVPRPSQKALLAEGNTLIFRVFLHEGYDGRLTIDDMKKTLPVLLTGMPDAGPPDTEEPAASPEPPAEPPEPPRPSPQVVVLKALIEVGAKNLEEGNTQAFLMMFLPFETVTALWQDGGAPLRKLLAELEPRRELLLWALRKCLRADPELAPDGRATFRFEDLPPGVRLEPLVFRESGGRWLLETVKFG